MTRDRSEEGMKTYHLMGIDFQFNMMKCVQSVVEVMVAQHCDNKQENSVVIPSIHISKVATYFTFI